MLELIFQGFVEWIYGMVLECWEYFASALLEVMSMDFAYLRSHIPVLAEIQQILLAVGWALLIGNLVFQALKSMSTGLGFEGEDPKLLFTRTFVFAFLLLASPQICEIGLNVTQTIINYLDIPDAVNITFADDASFAGLAAAWLLVVICGLIVMCKVFSLILEIAERYIILAVLTLCAPLAFGVGGSRNTSDIFTGWCRMFGSMCLVMVTNVIFLKMLLSVLAFVPSGLDVLPWMVLVFGIVKVAKKIDAIITRIGLNPAITGDGLGGRGLPGTLTYAVVRTVGRQIARSAGRNAGGKGHGGSTAPPGGGPNGPRPGPVLGGGTLFWRVGDSGPARRSGYARRAAGRRRTGKRRSPSAGKSHTLRSHPRCCGAVWRTVHGRQAAECGSLRLGGWYGQRGTKHGGLPEQFHAENLRHPRNAQGCLPYPPCRTSRHGRNSPSQGRRRRAGGSGARALCGTKRHSGDGPLCGRCRYAFRRGRNRAAQSGCTRGSSRSLRRGRESAGSACPLHRCFFPAGQRGRRGQPHCGD